MKKLLFICSGNIYRSAFSEFFLNKKGGNAICKSAGTNLFYPSPHPILIEISRNEFNIDMSNHVPTEVNLELAQWADIIICFKREHYDHVINTFDFKNKTFLIDNLVDIDDKSVFDDIDFLKLSNDAQSVVLLKKRLIEMGEILNKLWKKFQ